MATEENFQSHQLISKESPHAPVVANRPLQFPQDHRLHRDFQTEWWYVTCTLRGEDGNDYGVQFTLFSNLVTVSEHHRLFFAHAALSSRHQFFHGERFAREDMQHAGVIAEPWRAYLDHWTFTGTGAAPLPGTIQVQQPDYGYQLQLSDARYFLQGDQGYSVKDPHTKSASYYYNAPFIQVTGTIRIGAKSIRVTGDGWLDREWSSGMFSDASASKTSPNQGWDWLSLRLTPEQRLMIYRVNQGDHSHITGSLMFSDGRQIPLNESQIDWQPLEYQTFAGKDYPLTWQLRIPSQQIDINIAPLNPQQFFHGVIPYWEGMVNFNGTHQGTGYLELYY